MKERECG